MQQLRERDVTGVVVFAGGIVPASDVPVLAGLGIERVFPPGTSLSEIVTWLRARLRSGRDDATSPEEEP